MSALVGLSLKRVAPAAAVVALASACHLVPDDAADPARGVGVAVALHVLGESVDHAEHTAASPPPACRRPLPAAGPAEVTTVLTWTRKAPAVAVERIVETVRWHRDADGDIAARRELELRLPDGRVVHRTREDRVVGGDAFAAIDDRFAAADRIPGIRERTESAAFGATDALLSRVALDPSGRLVPAAGDGLCRPPEGSFGLPEGSLGPPEGNLPRGDADPSGGDLSPSSGGRFDQGLPPIDDAALTVDVRRRSGWLRWDDEAGDTHLIVTFDERVRSFDGDVVRPDRLWDVDPDRAWSSVSVFLESGLREGWLEPARVAETTADPDQP